MSEQIGAPMLPLTQPAASDGREVTDDDLVVETVVDKSMAALAGEAVSSPEAIAPPADVTAAEADVARIQEQQALLRKPLKPAEHVIERGQVYFSSMVTHCCEFVVDSIHGSGANVCAQLVRRNAPDNLSSVNMTLSDMRRYIEDGKFKYRGTVDPATTPALNRPASASAPQSPAPSYPASFDVASYLGRRFAWTPVEGTPIFNVAEILGVTLLAEVILKAEEPGRDDRSISAQQLQKEIAGGELVEVTAEREAERAAALATQSSPEAIAPQPPEVPGQTSAFPALAPEIPPAGVAAIASDPPAADGKAKRGRPKKGASESPAGQSSEALLLADLMNQIREKEEAKQKLAVEIEALKEQGRSVWAAEEARRRELDQTFRAIGIGI